MGFEFRCSSRVNVAWLTQMTELLCSGDGNSWERDGRGSLGWMVPV